MATMRPRSRTPRRAAIRVNAAMPDSVAAKLGSATCDGLKAAFWNAGMDSQSLQSGQEHRRAVQNLVESVLELADTCHVFGISELHPTHAS